MTTCTHTVIKKRVIKRVRASLSSWTSSRVQKRASPEISQELSGERRNCSVSHTPRTHYLKYVTPPMDHPPRLAARRRRRGNPPPPATRPRTAPAAPSCTSCARHPSADVCLGSAFEQPPTRTSPAVPTRKAGFRPTPAARISRAKTVWRRNRSPAHRRRLPRSPFWTKTRASPVTATRAAPPLPTLLNLPGRVVQGLSRQTVRR
mmetsp:Transcript_9704/g.40710  ORF Transcript_9704/g.40710 Transcript_9704/m.40710 type:complete len:205 (+) Transcript_9704:1345-1959(+)